MYSRYIPHNIVDINKTDDRTEAGLRFKRPKILPRSPKRVVAKMMYIFQTYKNTVLENELIINMIVLNMNKDLTIFT